MEKQYYPNGSLKLEVPLRSARRNGELIEYFESGEIKSKGHWEDGEQEGKTTVYYTNGNIEQEYIYEKGIVCCEAKFYREDGTLREIQFFDDFGRMIDYKKFKRDGNQNLDIQTRLPIILSVRDTVNEGDYYLSEIRLGNRRFNTIEVIIGNRDDPALLGKPRLPMKDSVTALLKIKAEIVGRNILEGVIIEINDASQDSLLVIPFSKAFYVKEGPTSSL
jgi:hypothetical protein